MSNAASCAFPLAVVNPGGNAWWECGLTKRELFAAMAMQGAMVGLGAVAHQIPTVDPVDPEALAIDACKMADALLAELEKKP